MTQHTQGPWIQDGLNITVPSGLYRIAKCLMDANGADHAEAEANARLMSAAPELLAALIEASNLFDNYPENAKEMIGTYEVINQAIAKATGA